MLMKGSAKLFDEFFAQPQEEGDHEDKPPPELEFMDLFLFNKKAVKWFEDRGCELIKVNMEPGDFVLWDSRTMHYAKFPEGDQIRHVQYICMTPRKFALDEALDYREAFNSKCYLASGGVSRMSAVDSWRMRTPISLSIRPLTSPHVNRVR